MERVKGKRLSDLQRPFTATLQIACIWSYQGFCNRANVLRNLATLGAATAMQ